MTDAGVSALAAECGKLQDIDISGCKKVTDAGISALAARCGKLQVVIAYSCDKLTDAGASDAIWVLHGGYMVPYVMR